MIVRINPLTTSSAQSFGSKKNVIKSAVDAGASAVQQSKPLHKGVMGKVGLPLALAAMVLAGAAALTSCDTGNGPVPDETIEEPADPTPTDPSNPTDPTDPTDPAGIVLTESQQAIMDNLLNNAIASNAIIQTNSTARSASSEIVSGKIDKISYTSPDGFTYNLTLDEDSLSENADVLVYKGTKHDDTYGDTINMTRTYYVSNNPDETMYNDDVDNMGNPNDLIIKDVNMGSYLDTYRVNKDNTDVKFAKKTPTPNPGELYVTTPDGLETYGTGYITNFNVNIQ